MVDLTWVEPVVSCLREHEENHEERETKKSGIEPPEVTPTHMVGHRARDNGSDHQRAHVEDPVESVPFSSVVQEKDVCNDGWLNGFGWSCTYAIYAKIY